jgi:hypothetical protein
LRLFANSMLTKIQILILLIFLFGRPDPAAGEAALLVAEPYGKFGFFNPTGHAAVYISGVCAETPTKLRPCEPGETGVVISRYNKIGGFDWIAVPLMPYLYAVEKPEDVLKIAEDEAIARVREKYRQAHLRDLVPDDPQRKVPEGDWMQLVGSAYERNIYGFTIETSIEEDMRLIELLNSGENRRRFNLIWRNCADFAREILNFYYPGAVKRNIIGDLGIMTPKSAARTLVKYSERHPELSFAHFMVPQIFGQRSSTRLRGVNESLIRSTKYVIPLIIIEPWAAVSAAAAYLLFGRFNPGGFDPTRCEPATISTCLLGGRNGLQQEGETAQTDAAPDMEIDIIGGAARLDKKAEQSESSEPGTVHDELLLD